MTTNGKRDVVLALVKKSTALSNLGRWKEALAATEQAIVINPKEARVWINKGWALAHLDCLKEALAATEQAIALDPKSARAWANKGWVLSRLGRWKEALLATHQTFAFDPKEKRAWGVKCFALGNQGRWQESLVASEYAIALDSKKAEAWNNKAKALAHLDRPEETLAANERAIALDPHFASAWRGKGWALGHLGRWKEALAATEQAIAINPKEAVAWNNKGWALTHLGRMEEALAATEQAIALDPKCAIAWANKGWFLVILGRDQEALLACGRAIACDPQEIIAWRIKGSALGVLRRWEESLAATEQAIAINPKEAVAWNNKGWALINLGRMEEALAATEQAIALDPKYARSWLNKARVFLTKSIPVHQCIARAVFLQTQDSRPYDRISPGEFLCILREHCSMPLLARRFLIEFPLMPNVISFSSFFRETMKQCETPLSIHTWLESANSLSNQDRLVWKGIVSFYHGDPIVAANCFNEVCKADESNLSAQHYRVSALQTYLEPCDVELRTAVHQAELALQHLTAATPVEKMYFAGQILASIGDWERAERCFAHTENHLPSLYMRWLCQRRQGRLGGESVVQAILDAEFHLVRQGKPGYLLPQPAPEIDVTSPEWCETFLFYVRFREIENAAIEFTERDNLDRYPACRKLFPAGQASLLGEHDRYLDQVKVWQLAAKSKEHLSELQHNKAQEQARVTYTQIRDWLDNLRLPNTFEGDQSKCSRTVGEKILNGMSNDNIPLSNIVHYYCSRGDLGIEDAVFLHFYHRLKMHCDGVDLEPLNKSVWVTKFMVAFAGLMSLVAQPFVWQASFASVAAAARLTQSLLEFAIKREQDYLNRLPFPSFNRFKDNFYEMEVTLGNTATLKDGAQ